MLLFQFFLAFFFELRIWNCVILNCVWTRGVYLNKLLDISTTNVHRSSDKVYYCCPTWTKLCSTNCSKHPKHLKKSWSEEVEVLNAYRHHEAEYIFVTVWQTSIKGVKRGGQKRQFFTPWFPSSCFVYLTNGLLNTVPVTLHSTYSTTQHDWANSWLHATKQATIVITGATVRQQLLGFTAS